LQVDVELLCSVAGKLFYICTNSKTEIMFNVLLFLLNMIYFSADLLVPVTLSPILGGVLALQEDGMISGVFLPGETPVPDSEIQKLHGILCPGFINTHCHLELSYLLGKINNGSSLDDFISQVEQEKKKADTTEILAAITDAEKEMVREGIVAVGDISNTGASFQAKKLRKLIYHTFIEVFGSVPERADEFFGKARQLFAQALADGLTASIVPHSLYSVSNELFRLIGDFEYKTGGVISLHHQENEDENRYFETGDGPVAERLRRFGIDVPVFKSPGRRPLPAVAHHLPWDNRTLLVHNLASTEEDIAYAMQNFNKLWWCLCPNSNLHISEKLPDIHALRRAGARITLGTDSLASNQRLSILEEMKTISKYYPEVGLEELLGWATINGAEALGFSEQLGSFEAGKRPGLVLIEQEVGENVVLAQDSMARRIM
jgi:aminodeoxyfutalosine deaminase